MEFRRGPSRTTLAPAEYASSGSGLGVNRAMPRDRSGRGRRPPFQSGESRIVAVKRDPFAIPLDRERRKPGVGDTRSARISFDAETLENTPVSLTRINNPARGVSQKNVAACERFRNGARDYQ